MTEPITSTLRDTNKWYSDADPMEVVDISLVDFVHAKSGKTVLDLGCGTGGYSKQLAQLGHTVTALDINAEYVKLAQQLGVDADTFDGSKIPLPDNSVDTVFALEVLEHVPDPQPLLKEIRRVARTNFIASVPNCTQTFAPAPVAWNHMLEVDHKNFFTKEAYANLLGSTFTRVEVREIEPVDRALAAETLPRLLFYVYRLSDNLGLIKHKYYFRLLAEATVN